MFKQHIWPREKSPSLRWHVSLHAGRARRPELIPSRPWLDDVLFIKLSGLLNVKVDVSSALMGYDYL